jgi:hypothetical protein
VVVDVTLPLVLLLRILVLLVVMRESRVVVLVSVSRLHVGDVFTGAVVVRDMDVLMLVHHGLMIMGIGHFLLRVSRSGSLSPAR